MQKIKAVSIIALLFVATFAAVAQPVITTPPASTNVCVGTPVSLSVEATGLEPFAYQWYLNETNAIDNAIEQVYFIPSATLANSGNYTVVITDANGSVTSAPPAVVTVNSLPSVSVNSPTICAGGTAMLTATTAASSPSYLWSPGGATTASISVSPSSTTVYSVTVTDGVTLCSTQAVATVTVNPLPSVSVNSATICPGGSAILTATSDASSPSYSWSPGGATTASITVSPGSTTVYTVTVTDGTTTCSAQGSGTVTVQAVTVAQINGATNVCPGSAVVLTATAGGSGPFSYTFRKGATVVQAAGPGNTFTIASVAAGDAGSYSVDITGACTTASATSGVSVVTAPLITAQPANVNGTFGGTASFSVTASGLNLTYQWSSNGVAISGATAATYTISPLQVGFSGASYGVTVQNCAGSVASATASLTVTPVGSVTFDFNTPNQYTNNFQTSVPGLTVLTYTEAASGGVGNSRVLDFGASAAGTDSTGVFMNQAYDFSYSGAVLNLSMMVKIKAPTANNRVLQIGFLNRPSTLTGERLTAFASLRVSSTAQPALTYAIQTQSKVNVGTGTIDGTQSATATLVAGNWYKLSMTMTNIKATTANTYTISGNFQDMGADGLTPGAVIFTQAPVNQNNADMANDSSVYAGFRSFDNAGADALDNMIITISQGAPSVVQAPQNQTVLQGRQAIMRAYIAGAGPVTYQWNRNGSPIAGATDWQYVIPATSMADDGATFSLTVNGTLTTASGTLTVTPDTTGPTLLSAGSFDGTRVGLSFDEPLDPVTAGNPANYTIAGATVISATLRADAVSVVLGVGPTLSGPFTVQVSNVQDRQGNAISAGSSASANAGSSGLTLIDVGNPTPLGSVVSLKDGEYEVTAGGADIWANFDQGSLVYLQKSGDFDVRVVVTNETYNIGNGGQITKAGIFARESLDPAARNLDIYVIPPWPGLNRYEGGLRPNPQAGTGGWGLSNNGGDPTNQGNTAANHPTSWLRLRRVGDTFTAYTSANGTTWSANSQTTAAWSNNLYVGLMMCAHANGFASTANFRGFGDTPGYAGATISLTANLTPTAPVLANSLQTATFSVTATVSGAPASELMYQWQRFDGSTWVNIPGANAASGSYTTPPLTPADSGAQFRVIVKANGATSVTSAVGTVTVTDTGAPTISNAYSPTGGVQSVVVIFSEPVSPATAQLAGNYNVTNASLASVGVTGATLYDARTVLLTLAAPLVSGTVNGVVVSAVQDTTGNTIAANSFKAFTPLTSLTVSNVVVERFLDNSQFPAAKTWVDALLIEPKFIQNAPDNVNYTNTFAWNQAINDTGVNNYGGRISSYFVPPANGTYRFYTRSDDLHRLFMNTNSANSTDPAGVVLIAEANIACCKNYGDTSGGPTVSAGIPLVGGQKYFMQALFKEGTGGDGFTMAVRESADASVPANTEAASSTLFSLPTGPMAITTITPATITVPENGFASFSVKGISGALPYKFQWFQGSTLVPNATAFSANLGPFALTDTTVSFVASNFFSRGVITAAVTVTPDTTAPTIVRAFGDAYFTSVTVVFSERVSQGSAETVGNYSIAGLTVSSAKLSADGTRVVLTTSPQEQGTLYTIVINNVQDRAATPNTIATDSSVNFSGWVMSPNSVKVELFLNNASLPSPRTSVPDLLLEPKFIANTPDIVLFTNIFAWQQTIASSGRDNYGGRLTAYFIPPSNGVYRFYIRSDDLSQLSMNPTGTDPAGKLVIAQQSLACCKNYGDLSGGPNTSAGIPLTGGGKYYMEALFKEGIGGDGFTLAWREASNPSVPPNSEAASGANFAAIENGDIIPGTITITQQPVDLGDVEQNHAIAFTVSATGPAGYFLGYQWQKDGVDIPLANSATLLIPRAQVSDSGTYSVKVTIPGKLVRSGSASVNVVPDVTGPSVAAAYGDPIPNHLRVVFSEAMEPSLVTDPARYVFSGGALATNALLLADGKTVILSVDFAFSAASDYVIEVAGDLTDLSGNAIVQTISPPFSAPWAVSSGVVLRESFFGNTTALPYDFNTLTNNPTFPNNPGRADYLTSFNSPQSSPDVNNYSVRVTGYVIPAVSGNYTFQVHADDSGWLRISQDAGAENRRTIVRAEGSCAACSNPQSTTVPLLAGYAYFVEGLMMEGSGGDYIDVSWKPPGASAFSIILAPNLAYSVNPDAVTLEITQQPHDVTVLERRTATFTAAAQGTGPVAYQWQQFDFGLSAWVNIANATNNTFRITPTDASTQNGSMYQMLASLSGLVNRTVNTDPVTLFVDDDVAGPAVVSAYSLGGTTIKVIFDEDLDLFSATDSASYTVTGSSVSHVDLYPGASGASNTVLLRLASQLPSSTFTVAGTVSDGGGNTASFSIDGSVFALGSGLVDDGNVGTALDPIEKGSTAADVNRLEVVAGGSDIWNNADGFRYAYGVYTNDFDVKVRVSRLDERNKWSKAGFVVREDLTANSHNLSLVATPNAAAALDGSGATANDFEAGNRPTVGAATADWGQFRPTPVPYPNAWIRFRRVGNAFTGFWASNGVNWIQFANTNQTFPATVYLGLGTTAHNNGAGQTTTAVYEDFGLILPPTIVTPPQSQTVLAGTPVTFGVTVSGEAPFTYQWRFNGGAILNETNATLTIASAQAGDVGSYDVVVNNLVGSATSAPATLTLAAPPSITTQPTDQLVECHGTATFTVAATGDAPLTYQWYYNDTTSLTDQTNATLTLGTVSIASSGNYKVVVTNPAGSTASVNAVLTVTDTTAPIIVCPSDITVFTAGNNATVNFTLPSASDACDNNVNVGSVPAPGSVFALGATTVNVTATDASLNSSGCTFTVNVIHITTPILQVIDYVGGNFRFSFQSQSGVTYLIQRKNSLDETEWTTLQTVPGTGSVLTIEDNSGPDTRFYQVTVAVQP